ncbi:histidine kinase [Streptomyces sp. NPDC001070]
MVAAARTPGELVRARRTAAAGTAEHAAAVEREKPPKARTAVVEERARINRELHDIVAHYVSLTMVQAITADRVQDHTRPHRLLKDRAEGELWAQARRRA